MLEIVKEVQDIRVQKIIQKWQNYLSSTNDWQPIVKNIQPRKCACGLVYEIPHPLASENESIAIVDMRDLPFCEPHYRPEIEIYFILQGAGLVVVGGHEYVVQKGSIVEIPSNTAHFTIPDKDLVMAIVNTPPFNVDHYYPLTESNSAVKFDKAQFESLLLAR